MAGGTGTLDDETERLLDDISAEIDERVARGEKVSIEEFKERYPHLVEHIEPLIDVAVALRKTSREVPGSKINLES